MKNKILVSIFFLLIILPLCSSVQIEMKSSYDIGETLVAKISGTFVQPISEQNILFYRRHMPTAMDSSLLKIDNDYYIYAQIPFEKIPDNYSMIIQGVKYFQGNEIKEENIVYNFSITNKTADFSIEPAAIITTTDFSISVQNFQDKEISIKVYFSNKTSSSGGFFSFLEGEQSNEIYSFSLDSGEEKSINFKIDDLNNGLNTIKIKSDNLEYLIPAYITKEKEKPKLSFEDDEIRLSLEINSTGSRKILIFNSGNEPVNGISLSLSNSLKPYANLSSDFITEIKSNSSENVTLTIFSEEDGYITGFLKAELENDTKSLSISIDFAKDYNSSERNTSEYEIITPNISKTCSELGGKPCSGKFKCNGTLVSAKDDVCCVGSCDSPNPSSTRKLIGWSLLIISIVILFWFLATKYLRTKNKVNFSSALRRR